LAWSALGEKRKALDFYEQALPLQRAVGDRGGEAVTCFNIGMVYHQLGDLDQAIAYVERCVELDEQVEHPDLESDRRALEQLKQLRAGGTSAPADPQAEFARQIMQLYAQGGAAAVRDALLGAGATPEQIDSILAQVEAATSAPASAAASTLPDETVQMLCGNTVAVRTSVPEKLDEWQAQLVAIHADWLTRGDDWANEVAFAAALLAVLAGESPALPDENPYADVVAQVVKNITP
jgi:tetratricopeptide (TPR) repeat protein